MRTDPRSTDLIAKKTYKSFFCSTTFWAIFFLALEAIASHLEEALRDGIITSSDGFAIVRIIAATAAGFMGRYNASEIVYTPKGFPGRDKREAEKLINPE